jgi:hypothetical protein
MMKDKIRSTSVADKHTKGDVTLPDVTFSCGYDTTLEIFRNNAGHDCFVTAKRVAIDAAKPKILFDTNLPLSGIRNSIGRLNNRGLNCHRDVICALTYALHYQEALDIPLDMSLNDIIYHETYGKFYSWTVEPKMIEDYIAAIELFRVTGTYISVARFLPSEFWDNKTIIVPIVEPKGFRERIIDLDSKNPKWGRWMTKKFVSLSDSDLFSIQYALVNEYRKLGAKVQVFNLIYGEQAYLNNLMMLQEIAHQSLGDHRPEHPITSVFGTDHQDGKKIVQSIWG